MGSIVIGSGYRGITFLKILSRLGEKVCGVVESNISKHNFVKWQMEKENCPIPPFFTDYIEAFDKLPEADKVFIITPDFTHRKIFEECIKRKYNIFLEKPIDKSKKRAILLKVSIREQIQKGIQICLPQCSKKKRLSANGT